MAEPVKISQLPTGATPSAADLFVSVQSGTTVKVSQAQMKSGLNLATVATTGDYNDLTNKPSIPAAQVNSDWNATSGVAQILNKPTLGTMAEQDANNVAITGGSINNTPIGNTTPNAATFTTLSTGALTATGQTSLGGASGSESFRAVPVASAVNFLEARGGVAGNTNFPRLLTEGADANIWMTLFAKGATGIRNFVNGAEQFRVAATASAVNYVQVTGAATGNRPVISAQGSDTNIAVALQSKGTGLIYLQNANGGAGFAASAPIGASANYCQATAAAASSSPVLSAQGTDTNIDLALTPKGTGLVRFGTRTASADAPITGYIEIKDSGGTTRRLAVIG